MKLFDRIMIYLFFKTQNKLLFINFSNAKFLHYWLSYIGYFIF